MSIRKRYIKSKPVCKVTFRIPEKIGSSAGSAVIVGDFSLNFFLKYFEKPRSALFSNFL